MGALVVVINPGRLRGARTAHGHLQESQSLLPQVPKLLSDQSLGLSCMPCIFDPH